MNPERAKLLDLQTRRHYQYSLRHQPAKNYRCSAVVVDQIGLTGQTIEHRSVRFGNRPDGCSDPGQTVPAVDMYQEVASDLPSEVSNCEQSK